MGRMNKLGKTVCFALVLIALVSCDNDVTVKKDYYENGTLKFTSEIIK